MALNPPLDSYGNPFRVNGEYFIMKRDGAEFEFKVSGGNKYTGKGQVNKIFNIYLISCNLDDINILQSYLS